MTVENISIAVKTTGADTAARHINSLVASLEKLEKATTSMTGVANLAELGKAFSTLASNRVSVSSFNSIAKGVERLGEALKSLSVEDAHILDKVTASMARLQGVDLKGFGSAVSAAHRVGEASQQAQMAVSEDVQSIIENASQVDILTHKLDGLKDALQEAFDTGNIEKAYALRGQILQVEDAIKRATEAAKKSSSAFGSFFASLKRIAMYRALRTIIKAITQAIKEGIDNLYEYSKAHDDFAGIASSFDGLASAAQTTKNQLGTTFGQMLAAASPILIALMDLIRQLTQVFYPLVQAISALAPVLTTIIGLVTDLVNAILSLFDLLGLNVGKIVAQDATAQWKDAKKAAGDYKKTILGFDEINRLNGPSGGGGGTTGGTFESGDFGYKTFDPDKLEWIAVFKQKIDDLKSGILDLVAELAGIPDSVIIELLAKDNATEPLNGLVRTVQSSFPLVANVVMAIQGNPLPFIKTVRSAIVNFVQDSVGSFSEWQTAYAGACATVEAESLSLADSFDFSFSGIADTIAGWVSDFQQRVAEYQAAAETAMVENSTLQSDVETTFANIKSAIDGWVSHFWEKVGEYQTASGALQTENSTLGQDVADTYNRMRNPIDNWVTNFWNKVEEYQNASGALQIENSTLLSDVNTTFENIKENIRTSIENVKGNIDTFVTETSEQWGTWAKNTAENARLAFDNIANNVYTSLTNAAENVASFVNNTASNIWSWATNTAQNIATWAGNVAENVGKTLKTAWENFKEFMSATGQAVSGWWNENKTWAIPAAIGAAVTVAAVALAPATGGASLAGLALAADGGAFPNNGSLFVAGEAGPEIVANMGSKTGVMNVDQMESAVANGNIGVINAIYGMANAIVRAVESIDTDITLDGESVAEKLYRPMQSVSNRHGAAMVT